MWNACGQWPIDELTLPSTLLQEMEIRGIGEDWGFGRVPTWGMAPYLPINGGDNRSEYLSLNLMSPLLKKSLTMVAVLVLD
ncbi:hypothetical protein SDJN03_12247, partial [Cucurbita argyrosperma subsp. sororia]